MPDIQTAGDFDGFIRTAVIDDHDLDLINAVDPFGQIADHVRQVFFFIINNKESE